MDNKKIVLSHFDRVADNNYYLTVCNRRKNYNNTVDDIVLQSLRLSSCPTILDAGCGLGHRAQKYKDDLYESRVYGIDFSSKMIEHAAKKNLDEVLCGSIVNIPFADEKFDYITCLFFVFCYLTSKEERVLALKEFYRVLKPGGTLFLDLIPVSHKGEGGDFKRNQWDIVIEHCKSLFKKGIKSGDKIYKVSNPDGVVSYNFFHAFSEREFRNLVKQSGFSIDERIIIGYSTGRIHKRKSKGQHLYILKKG